MNSQCVRYYYVSMLLRMRTASASLRPSVWTSFRVKYEVETVLVQVVNSSKMPTSSGPTRTRSTIVTETPRDDWHVSWRTAVLLQPCTLVGLVTFRYKYDLRSDLRAPNFKNFHGGACPQTPPSVCVLTHAPSSMPPQSQVPSAATVWSYYIHKSITTWQDNICPPPQPFARFESTVTESRERVPIGGAPCKFVKEGFGVSADSNVSAFNYERAPMSCLQRLDALEGNNWT